VIPQPETVMADADEVIALTVPEAEAEVRSILVGESSAPSA
jgi:Trk K+ transport system NAD-binding subunit